MCDGAGTCGGGQAVRRVVRPVFTCGLLVALCGVVLCGVVRCGAVLCVVVWCGVVWCSVVLCVVWCCTWSRGGGTCVDGVYLAKCKPGFPPPLGLPSGIRRSVHRGAGASSLSIGH